ncbi:hypothetical protein [Flexivirga sp. B27]
MTGLPFFFPPVSGSVFGFFGGVDDGALVVGLDERCVWEVDDE